MKTKSLRCMIFVLASFLLISSCSDDKSNSKKEESKPATESENTSSMDSSLDDLLDISKILESLSSDSSSDPSLTSILDFVKNLLNSDGQIAGVVSKDVDSTTTLVPTTTSSNLLNLQELLNTDDLLNNSSVLNIKEVLKDNELSSEELESIKDFLSRHGVNTDHKLLTQTEKDDILSWIEQNSRSFLNHLSDFGIDLDQQFLMDLADKIFQE